MGCNTAKGSLSLELLLAIPTQLSVRIDNGNRNLTPITSRAGLCCCADCLENKLIFNSHSYELAPGDENAPLAATDIAQPHTRASTATINYTWSHLLAKWTWMAALEPSGSSSCSIRQVRIETGTGHSTTACRSTHHDRLRQAKYLICDAMGCAVAMRVHKKRCGGRDEWIQSCPSKCSAGIRRRLLRPAH